MNTTSQEDNSEFHFLDKWTFSSKLEARLKKFAISPTYEIAIKSCTIDQDRHASDNATENLEGNDVEPHETNTGRTGDNEAEPCVNNVDTDIQPNTQQISCSQDTRKFVAALREGPIESDVLCEISNEDIISLLQSTSYDIILNFCESVCLALELQNRLVPLLCENLLLPKIRDSPFTTCSRTWIPVIKRAFETFPLMASSYILIPLLKESDWIRKLDPVLSDLENESRRLVLKSLLDGGIQILEEHHVPLIRNLLVAGVERDVNEKVIDLLLHSGNNLCKSPNFGKLLVFVTKQVGPYLATDAKMKLRTVIETHKSIQKALAMKAFQTLESK